MDFGRTVFQMLEAAATVVRNGATLSFSGDVS
jgi:hypothetical protein